MLGLKLDTGTAIPFSKGSRLFQEKETKSLYCGSGFITVDPDPDSGSPINPDPNTVRGP
jgi:hypothetical protein